MDSLKRALRKAVSFHRCYPISCLTNWIGGIHSQWTGMPTKRQYAVGVSANGSLIHSSRYGSLRNLTKLKECHIVRYADDFRIFCKTRGDAQKLFYATKDWLHHRLRLEINEQKSQIVNLKKRYSEFLGFKMKLNRRGKKKNGEPKYIVKATSLKISRENSAESKRAHLQHPKSCGQKRPICSNVRLQFICHRRSQLL